MRTNTIANAHTNSRTTSGEAKESFPGEASFKMQDLRASRPRGGVGAPRRPLHDTSTKCSGQFQFRAAPAAAAALRTTEPTPPNVARARDGFLVPHRVAVLFHLVSAVHIRGRARRAVARQRQHRQRQLLQPAEPDEGGEERIGKARPRGQRRQAGQRRRQRREETLAAAPIAATVAGEGAHGVLRDGRRPSRQLVRESRRGTRGEGGARAGQQGRRRASLHARGGRGQKRSVSQAESVTARRARRSWSSHQITVRKRT